MITHKNEYIFKAIAFILIYAGLGFSTLILALFYDSMIEYKAQLMWVISKAFIALVVFALWRVILSNLHRAMVNDHFNRTNQQLLESCVDADGDTNELSEIEEPYFR